MTNPIHPWLPPGVRPYTAEELFVELAGPPVDPARWTLPFTAKLAPLGVASDDGRTLSARHPWRLRDGLPVAVKIDNPDRVDAATWPAVVIGRVDVLTVTADELFAAGVLDPDVDLTGLAPQVELKPHDVDLLDHDVVERMAIVFNGGAVTAVKLGTAPAFGDVWLRTPDR